MVFQKGNKIGHRFTKGHKINIGRKLSLSKIGNKYPLGCKRSPESNMKNRLAHLGEKNYIWKGNEVGYSALHQWVRRHLPKPELCQRCNKKPSIDLANITGYYNRDFENWKYLCRSCHVKTDGRIINLIISPGNREGINQYTKKCTPLITPPEEEID